MQRFRLPIFSAGFVLFFSSTLTPQDTEVRGAAIALVLKTIDVGTVTIENRRASPLIAWAVRWESTGGMSMTGTDFATDHVPHRRGDGPIAPGERRTIERRFSEPSPLLPATLDLAVFADGYIEGRPDAVERWQRERREHADDAAYWVRAFAAMPRDSEAAAKTYLAERMAERSAEARGDRSSMRAQLAGMWQDSPHAPRVFPTVERLGGEAQRQYAALTRLLTARHTAEASPSVVLSSERSTTAEYHVMVTNLRQVPIEAFGFGVTGARTLGVQTSQMTDFCMSEPGDARGRIAPGESREVHPGTKFPPSSQLPTVKLTFVLYDDLTFEGSSEQRDQMLRRREAEADDIAYLNAVREELAAVPDDKVKAFLLGKRAERTKQLLAQGRRPEQHLLDELIEDATRAPERLRQLAPAVSAITEEQRQRLLRHRR